MSMTKTPAKIIWDQDSAGVYISGFSTAVKVDPTKERNREKYAIFQLTKRPRYNWEDITLWEW